MLFNDAVVAVIARDGIRLVAFTTTITTTATTSVAATTTTTGIMDTGEAAGKTDADSNAAGVVSDVAIQCSSATGSVLMPTAAIASAGVNVMSCWKLHLVNVFFHIGLLLGNYFGSCMNSPLLVS